MFGQTFDGKIRAIVPRVRDNGEDIERSCLLSLQFEFTDDTASGLGEVGQDALKHLRSGAQNSARIMIDALNVVGKFETAQNHKLTVKNLKGVNASVKRANKEDANPTLNARFAFSTDGDQLLYFVDHLDETVKVKLDKLQTEIPGT